MWVFDQMLPWNHGWIMRQWTPGHRHKKAPLHSTYISKKRSLKTDDFSSILDQPVFLWSFLLSFCCCCASLQLSFCCRSTCLCSDVASYVTVVFLWSFCFSLYSYLKCLLLLCVSLWQFSVIPWLLCASVWPFCISL